MHSIKFGQVKIQDFFLEGGLISGGWGIFHFLFYFNFLMEKGLQESNFEGEMNREKSFLITKWAEIQSELYAQSEASLMAKSNLNLKDNFL